MKKAPEAFRTISEVSDILDTPAHVLRFWESKFYQVRPVKRAGGRRYYRPDDLALIAGIKHLLQDRGMTIRGVQKIMQEEGVRHVIALGRNSGLLASEDETVLEIAVTAPADTPAPGTAPPAPAAVTHLASPQLANPQVGSAPTMETPVEIPAAVASPEPPASAPPQPVVGWKARLVLGRQRTTHREEQRVDDHHVGHGDEPRHHVVATPLLRRQQVRQRDRNRVARNEEPELGDAEPQPAAAQCVRFWGVLHEAGGR